MALTTCPECKGPVSSDAKSCPHCGKRLTGGTGYFSGIAIMFLVVIIVLVLPNWSTTSTQQRTGELTASSPRTATPPEPDRATLARQYTKIKITSLEKAGFDNIMVINAVLINGNNFPVKDVEITCTPVARSGTALRRLVRTAYEIVPTKGERVLTKFSMGIMSDQSHQASCEVTDAQPVR